jgi:hypothetical protein
MLGKLIGVGVVAGFLAASTGGVMALASKHVKDPPSCTLSGTTSGGAPLTLTGSGYTPGDSYLADFLWPNGTAGGFAAAADPAGDIQVDTYAWSSGTYTVDVYSTQGSQAELATCSIAVPTS